MADDEDDRGSGVVMTAVAIALAVVIGLFVGGITSFTHRQWPLELGGIRVPIGLLVGVVLVGLVVVGIRLAFQSRLVALAAALGVLAAIAVLASRGPGGSVVVVQDAIGWTWVIAPLAVAAIAIVWPRRRVGTAVAAE